MQHVKEHLRWLLVQVSIIKIISMVLQRLTKTKALGKLLENFAA